MTVSAQRTLIVASPTPFARLPLRWPMAEPDDALDYSLNIAALLADGGDTIASASLAISPSGEGELLAQSLVVSGSVITGWLSGGMAARSYVVRVGAETDGGRQFEWLVSLLIDPFSATSILPAALSRDFGTAITWSSGATSLDFAQSNNSALTALL